MCIMNKLAILIVLLMAVVAYGGGTLDTIAVTPGAGALLSTELRSQGGTAAVEDEVVVCTYGHANDPTQRKITASACGGSCTPGAAFASTTPCHSLLVTSAITNTGTVYVTYSTTLTCDSGTCNGTPIYPGGMKQFRPPLVGTSPNEILECANIYIGSDTASTVVHVMSQ
jgi:hypothetical protein